MKTLILSYNGYLWTANYSSAGGNNWNVNLTNDYDFIERDFVYITSTPDIDLEIIGDISGLAQVILQP